MSFLVLYGFLRLHLQSALVGQPGCQEVPAQRRQRSNERVLAYSDMTWFWGKFRLDGKQRIALFPVVASLEQKRLGDEFSSSIGAFFHPHSSNPIRS